MSRGLRIIFVMTILVTDVFCDIKSTVKNILEYGAFGDGKTLNTSIIQKTIDEIASTGGGTIIFPSGIYLTGSLELKSNIDIYIANGATILGSININDYTEHTPQIRSYNDLFLKYSLFYAEKAENISIRGEGIIDGQGSFFKVITKEKPERYKNRPYIIRFVECKNIKVENVTMQNSAMWMQQYLACEDLFIRGIRVFNHANQNNDMMDIDGCKNVIISDCIGDTDDDCITLKSTSSYVTQNVTITNCVVSSHCNAIKLGTESHGGFRNIAISNMVVKPSFDTEPIFGQIKGISGITLGMVDGGILEGVTISNVIIEGTDVPIYLRLGNRGRKYFSEQSQIGVGIFKNVIISEIIAYDVQSTIGCSITGIPEHDIQNVQLRNISIEFPGGGSKEDANKILPELEDHYPESTKWGNLPSYGFFIRHVKNISLSNIELRVSGDDNRPALICDDVRIININGLKAKAGSEADYLISFKDVSDGIIQSSSILSNVSTFLEVKGEKSKNISILNNVLKSVNQIVNNKTEIKIEQLGNIQ